MRKHKKKKVKNKSDLKAVYLLTRYLVLLGLMFTLPLIYKIFTPLTVYSTSFLLKILYNVAIYKNFITINALTIIEIVPACVAGSAYLLLLILNLSVELKLLPRLKSMILLFLSLFVLNILRIAFLTILLVNNFKFFDLTHKFFWYVLSTVFVVGLWFAIVKIYSIKPIPVYSDIKYLTDNIKKGFKKPKKKRRTKKSKP